MEAMARHPQLLELERDSSPVADNQNIPFLLSLRNPEEFAKAHSFGPLKVPHIGKSSARCPPSLHTYIVSVSRCVWCRVYPLFHCGSALLACHSQVSNAISTMPYVCVCWAVGLPIYSVRLLYVCSILFQGYISLHESLILPK